MTTANLGRIWPLLLAVFLTLLVVLLLTGFPMARRQALGEAERRADGVTERLAKHSLNFGQPSLLVPGDAGQVHIADFVAGANNALQDVEFREDFQIYVYEKNVVAIASSAGSLVGATSSDSSPRTTLYLENSTDLEVAEGVGKRSPFTYPDQEQQTHFVVIRSDVENDRLVVVDAREAGIVDRAYATPRTLLALLLVGIAAVLPATVYRVSHRRESDAGQAVNSRRGDLEQEAGQ